MSDPVPSDLAVALGAAAPRLGAFADLRYFDEVDSTNDLALRLAESGAPEGVSVLAGRQRAGRGRRGHAWFSPAGAGVYLSVIVRPFHRTLNLVTIAAGVAVADALIEISGLPVELKWPNDVVIGRPWRKLGGLLCESVGAGGRIDAVVVGIGINLLQSAYPPELANRATSIEAELGRSVDRAAVVATCLGHLKEAMAILHAGERAAVCESWRRLGRGSLGGSPVRWRSDGVDVRGFARDIDDDGALVVERAGGIERLISGEVSWDSFSHDA